MSLNNQDLTTIVFGKTGVGKSSTLNALFGLSLATDDSIACTKEPQPINIEYSHCKDLILPYGNITVVDMPGIGESVDKDEEYMVFYKEWIPKANSLVWITQADTRAYKRDEIFLSKLAPLLNPSILLTVALNKIDCLGVNEDEQPFDNIRGKPSIDQLKQLPEKVEDIYSIFKNAVGDNFFFEKEHIVPYTSMYGWGLQNLKSKILTRR